MDKGIKKLLTIGGIVLLALAIFGVISIPKVNVGSLSVGGEKQAAEAAAAGAVVAGAKQLSSDNVVLSMMTAYSDSPSNADGATWNVYKSGVNPKDPSAVVIVAGELARGYTGGLLRSNTQYRVTVENATTMYAVDLGDIVLCPESSYNTETADCVVDLTDLTGKKLVTVATLSDMLDEAGDPAQINGVTSGSENCNNTTAEFCNNASSADWGADGVITYDISNGDGAAYIDLVFAATGSQAALIEPVVCFEYDDRTNAPESNEISDLVVSRQTGTDYNFPVSVNWESVWANEECIIFGSDTVNGKKVLKAGDSGEYRFTFTYNEANLDGNDDFLIVYNDLGDKLGKDDELNAGATRDTVDMDAVA